MREIKFRGKRVDNGEWVYGLPLYSVVGGKAIIDTIQSCEDLCFYTVIPETVGQFTGLKDKNGKKIYEGDVVGFRRKKKECIDVCYDKGRYLCKVKTGINCTTFYQLCLFIDKYQCEVIGNIYENPELLEGNNENN